MRLLQLPNFTLFVALTLTLLQQAPIVFSSDINISLSEETSTVASEEEIKVVAVSSNFKLVPISITTSAFPLLFLSPKALLLSVSSTFNVLYYFVLSSLLSPLPSSFHCLIFTNFLM